MGANGKEFGIFKRGDKKYLVESYESYNGWVASFFENEGGYTYSGTESHYIEARNRRELGLKLINLGYEFVE